MTHSSSGGGLQLVLGNDRLMQDQNVTVGQEAQAFMQEHEPQVCVYMCERRRESVICGWVGVDVTATRTVGGTT